MVPDSWCTPFHKITGTSGPYLFYGGLFAFLVNKELWVFEEQAHMLVGWILFYLLLSRTVGYRLDKYLYGEYQNRMNYFKGLIQEDLKDAVEFRKTSAAETESLNTVKEAFPTIMKENMQLQLEATYRKNVATVANELQRRVNFLKETEEAKKRFERDIMLKWIVEGVEKQTQDSKFKEQFLASSIQQLKGLSAKL
jgi:F-type H+-transporting ATPase subunit b